MQKSTLSLIHFALFFLIHLVKLVPVTVFTFSATAGFKARVATFSATSATPEAVCNLCNCLQPLQLSATACNCNYDDLVSKMEPHNCKMGFIVFK